MSENFGNGVSRTLSALGRQFDSVVWQKGKPPLDSEFNLMSQIDIEKIQQLVRSQMNSGFLIDPTTTQEDYQFQKDWANLFKFGTEDGTNKPCLYANVGGMIVPVSGTFNTSFSNIIKLSPPPESDSRVDFVFLEVWKTLVAPNPSTLNKPTSTEIWKYGNVEFGGTNCVDDLEDPNIGFETTERVQVQYRIRVYGSGVGLGAGIALQDHPDGLGDPNILGQGTSSSPIGGFPFLNMKETLSDPSLWRAGDGDSDNALGTVDGYVYAIPICAIFRRNSNPFVATNLSGNPNQNGGFNRTPSSSFLANPRDGAKGLTTPTIVNDLTPNFLGEIEVADLIGSGLDDSQHTVENLKIIIGSEICSVSSINTTNTPHTITLSQRGRYGSAEMGHKANTPIQMFNTRVDGKFSDEITQTDLLDLRRSVTMGEWDYDRILQNNLSLLLSGGLRSSFKRSAIGDTEGTTVTEVSYLFADGTTDVPNHTEAVDGPDGIRTCFSDGATIERDVTLLIDNNATLTNGVTTDQYDTNVGWDVAPDFKPSGFINNDGSSGSFTNGSMFFLHIGGEDGSSGARNSFRDGSERAVRFLSPREFWKTGYPVIDPKNGNQYPITLRFINQKSHLPMADNEDIVDSNASSKHPGPMYPVRNLNFEYPFLVLGGILHSSLKTTATVNTSFSNHSTYASTGYVQIDTGIDFNVGFHSMDTAGQFESDPTKIAKPLLHGERTLYDMLTNYGKDHTGESSEVYVVVYGDTTANCKYNNGAFKVVGAGTVGYTQLDGSTASTIVLKPLDADWQGFDTTSTRAVTIEFRSQHTHSLDGGGLVAGTPSVCIVLTDILGTKEHKWKKTLLDNSQGVLDYSLPTDTYDGNPIPKVESKIVLSTSLIYEPNRGATARVADVINTIAMENADSTILRESKGGLDASFSGSTGTPTSDVEFLPTHIQLWNRLPSLGWHAPTAPSYGGKVVANSEQDRECESFYDRGSKTLVLRPYRQRRMTLQAHTLQLTTLSDQVTSACLLGGYAYPNGIAKDSLTLFTGDETTGKKMGFTLPPEFMPRFGRQDIPYSTTVGGFLPGINHLFLDSSELNNEVFKIIGGEDNISGGSLVKPMYFRTNAPASYGESGTVIGAALNKPYYEARKSTDIGTATANQKSVVNKFKSVRSSDLGNGLKGIQLPPYLGVARIYGVYDYDDYIAKGGRTFIADRINLDNDVATNLLRTDNHTQSLFIMRDGALDLTGEKGDHTYVLPSNALNLTLSPNHKLNDPTSGKENFEDFQYIIECTVFGFAKNWINGNNYVLARRHDAQGNLISDGADEQLEDLSMVFPCAAPLNSRVKMTYNRTVYQGDPYFTRFGNVKTITDYERRYGQISRANTYALNHPIQQFDNNGESLIEMPNQRVFQILASVDFYTTMGSGKIGGILHPGTLMDVGFLQNNKHRIAESASDNRLQVFPRAFTESQITNSSRAKATIKQREKTDHTKLDGVEFKITRLDGAVVTITFNTVSQLVDTEFQGYLQTNSDYLLNMRALAEKINSMGSLALTCFAKPLGDTVELLSVVTGDQGNHIRLSMVNPTGGEFPQEVFHLLNEVDNLNPNYTNGVYSPTSVYFRGGKDIAINAGNGTSQINLVGMTERLPLGILANDSDFLCENPLGDSSSAMQTYSSSIRPTQKLLPLTKQGEEVSRFMGTPSEYISFSDGGVLNYSAYDEVDRPTGTKKYRIFRGGGSAMLLSGVNPGGPLEFVSGNLSAPLNPVLKGAVLVGKALLVKNFTETVYNDPTKKVSCGEEIQMVVITNAIYGDQNTTKEGIVLSSEISPSGYGEGFAAADRYRLCGKPMFAPNSQAKPNFNISPVPFIKNEEE